MVNFKKFVAVLCSATMVAATPLTAFASDPSSTAADGNIIAFSAETVTVPTSIKVSFNPQEWDFKYDASSEAVNDQIVSLNYGISSMATMDKKVNIEFEASGTEADGKDPIVFVDTAAKASAKSDTNTDGAEVGEFKMYLAVAGGGAAIAKSRDNTAFAVANGASNVTAALLADVAMTAEDGGAQAFAAGGDGLASTSIAFTLGAAEYALKSGSTPMFDTTQTAFAAMVEAKELGDIVGFTFIGAMNKNADWTKANLSAITITPTYEFEDATGEETAVTGGAYNQIEAGASAAAATSISGAYNSTSNAYVLTLPAAVTAVTNLQVNGKAVSNFTMNSAKTKVTVAKPDVKTAMGDDWATATDLTFTFTADGTNYSAANVAK